MRVKLKTLMAGPEGVSQVGQTITVTDDEGKQLLDGGFAELVSVSADEEVPPSDVDESLANDLVPDDTTTDDGDPDGDDTTSEPPSTDSTHATTDEQSDDQSDDQRGETKPKRPKKPKSNKG